MFDLVIKIQKDVNNNPIWYALYNSKGNMIFENSHIDIGEAIKLFSNGDYKVYEIFDDNLKEFPKYEDFSYLLDGKTIKVGSIVYLNDDTYTIDSIIGESLRPEGYYDYYNWDTIDGVPLSFKTKKYYPEHSVLSFSVKENNNTYIWEDYSYQQENIYKKIKLIGKIV